MVEFHSRRPGRGSRRPLMKGGGIITRSGPIGSRLSLSRGGGLLRIFTGISGVTFVGSTYMMRTIDHAGFGSIPELSIAFTRMLSGCYPDE